MEGGFWEFQVDKGVVLHRATGKARDVRLMATAASQLTPPTEVKLKDAKSSPLIGSPTRRLDTPSRNEWKRQFGLDVSLPGMLMLSWRGPRYSAQKWEG